MSDSFATPQAFRSITAEFDRFCKQQFITVLTRCTVRHWCWEWSGCKLEDINHYLTILAAEEPPSTDDYSFEFWAEADNDKRFTRKRVMHKRLSVNELTDQSFPSIFNGMLTTTWAAATKLTTRNLNHQYESHKVHEGSLSNRRILVIEEDSALRRSIKQMLERGHWPVIIEQARNVSEALGMVETLKPDLLLLDIGMPTLSGLEILKQIGKKEGAESSPVILTVHQNLHGLPEKFRAQYPEYLTKEWMESLERIIRDRFKNRTVAIHFWEPPPRDSL